jgi:hypothetical protein
MHRAPPLQRTVTSHRCTGVDQGAGPERVQLAVGVKLSRWGRLEYRARLLRSLRLPRPAAARLGGSAITRGTFGGAGTRQLGVGNLDAPSGSKKPDAVPLGF